MKIMSLYIFETVELKNQYPANILITSIGESRFHWHYEYELIIVLKGSIVVNTIPKPIVMKQNDIIMINSKTVHEVKQTEEENICLIIQLNPEEFKNSFEPNVRYYFYLNSVTNEISPYREYRHFINISAQLALKFLEDSRIGYYRINAIIHTIIADLFEYVAYDMCLSANSINEDIQTLMEIIEYFQRNLSDKDVLKSLYKDLGISEKTAYRFLKDNIGMSAKELVTSMKIDKVKHLLKYTSKSISYIIDVCGFGSENSFYRIFKNEVGVTPNEYRVRGTNLEKNPKVRGYLDFKENEAKEALIKILEGNYEM